MPTATLEHKQEQTDAKITSAATGSITERVPGVNPGEQQSYSARAELD